MGIILMGLLLLQGVTAVQWSVETESKNVTVRMGQMISVPFSVLINSIDSSDYMLLVNSTESIATVTSEITHKTDAFQNGTFNITGIFLGTTNISISLVKDKVIQDTRNVLKVIVIQKKNVLFMISIGLLMSILYINFGCALDWEVCGQTLKKPVGPAIGFCSQFIFMPLASYGIGYLIFRDQPELHLGMFFTGVSPSGGASNLWTVLLGGNINLSITMTTICTIAAFGMMPLWIFSLGRYIFAQGNFAVPYVQITEFVFTLIVPLAIGYVIKRKLPKVSRILVRIMKPLSIALILIIVTLAIVTNYYLFKLFSLQILLAAFILPWLGFLFGFLIAAVFRQHKRDMITIAIETCIQNTGIPIFLLKFTLPSPADDMTTVVPIAYAIATPIPLIFFYILTLIRNRKKKQCLESHVSLNGQQNYTGTSLSKL